MQYPSYTSTASHQLLTRSGTGGLRSAGRPTTQVGPCYEFVTQELNCGPADRIHVPRAPACSTPQPDKRTPACCTADMSSPVPWGEPQHARVGPMVDLCFDMDTYAHGEAACLASEYRSRPAYTCIDGVMGHVLTRALGTTPAHPGRDLHDLCRHVITCTWRQNPASCSTQPPADALPASGPPPAAFAATQGIPWSRTKIHTAQEVQSQETQGTIGTVNASSSLLTDRWNKKNKHT